MGLGEVVLGQLADAFFAVDGKENGGHEGDESLIGADVGSGFLAADVLLTGGERENEAAVALAIDGLATRRPGICRTYCSLAAMTPQKGPP